MEEKKLNEHLVQMKKSKKVTFLTNQHTHTQGFCAVEGSYKAAINGDWEIAADTEVNPISKLATRSASHVAARGCASGCENTNALRDGKIGDDEVFGTRHRHRLQRRWRSRQTAAAAVRRKAFAKPDLKHFCLSDVLSPCTLLLAMVRLHGLSFLK